MSHIHHLPIVSDIVVEERGPEEGLRLLAIPLGLIGAPDLRLPDDDGPDAAAVVRVLQAAREGMAARRPGDPAWVIMLDKISAEARRLLAETLGEGEVRATVRGALTYHVRESLLPGLWRVASVMGDGDGDGDGAGTIVEEHLEIAEIPAVVRAAAARATTTELPMGDLPEGVMNVGAVLAELAHHVAAWRPGMPTHAVNLTLMPMNDVDLTTLAERVGRGPVEAESFGYGRCLVELTARRNLWSVRYLNAMGTPILDLLEIGDVPVALLAGAEDFEDSAARLGELIGVQASP